MDSHNVDLKQTINLPRTGFSMKANLSQAEPKLLDRWAGEDIYAQIRRARAGRPTYILHDGPPYANGRIHLGTAFNKILKDFIVKSKTMAGFDAPYVPGWDCHGLPIEIKVDSELGARKAKMTPAEIRAECRKYAEKYVDLQRTDFKRLGVFGRWDDPYLTMSAHYQSVIAAAFVEFLDRGYVYKGLKPVHWCMRDRTALAEAEVEYSNHSSPSIWVRFALTSDPAKIDPALAGHHVYGLIWTTTPWTIPANMAIAFHPKYEYVAVALSATEPRHTEPRPSGSGPVYLVAADLLKVTAEKCGWAHYEVLARLPGSRLEGAVFHHPFLERDSLGIRADHVTLEQGTGAVHTAPGHGQEDYVVGRQYGIETFCPVDAAGRFYHADGAPGRRSHPHRHRDPARASRPARIGKGRSQLSALLALPQADHLPRHRAVVHRYGPQRFPPARAGGHPPGALDARLGPGAHLQHDRHPPRLVHLAPTCVGRAHHRLLLRPLPRAAHRPQNPRRHRAPVRRTHRRRLVPAHRGRIAAARRGLRQVRRHGVQQGNRHSGRLVRLRIEPPGRAHPRQQPDLACESLHGRRRSVSRLVP